MNCAGYVTVGGSQHQHGVVPYMPDMSWLGAPRTERYAQHYEVARVIRHREALAAERQDLERQLVDLAGAFLETPRQRERATARINELQAKLQHRCACDICSAGDAQ